MSLVGDWAFTLKGTALTHESLKHFGLTMVIAPHPDDETLACGGLIALLRRQNQRVAVVVVSDGGNSHPNSKKLSREALCLMRKAETLEALGVLGLDAVDVHFLGYPDGKLSERAMTDFNEVVETLRARLSEFGPQTVLLPFRGEGHSDHCTTWYVVSEAARELYPRPRLLEYPLCVGPDTMTIFRQQTPTVWKLDISGVLAEKKRAVAAHRSQLGDMVDDDPAGFCLTPRLLANFVRAYEGYFEFSEKT